MSHTSLSPLFFFNHTATTDIYTLSLHDALPIFLESKRDLPTLKEALALCRRSLNDHPGRSEEHTSELQSHHDLVCRLLLEKKNYASTERTFFARTRPP